MEWSGTWTKQLFQYSREPIPRLARSDFAVIVYHTQILSILRFQSSPSTISADKQCVTFIENMQTPAQQLITMTTICSPIPSNV